MLVLTRKIKQKVRIVTPLGEVIDVCLLDIRGSSYARLGFAAAKDVKIHRLELLEEVEGKYGNTDKTKSGGESSSEKGSIGENSIGIR